MDSICMTPNIRKDRINMKETSSSVIGNIDTARFDSLKGSRDNSSSLLLSWLCRNNTLSLVNQPFAIFHKLKNFFSFNFSDINIEMENMELKYSTSCPADITKPSQFSFFYYINHPEDFPESIQNFTQFQNNKTSHKNQICTSVLMKNCNINPIEINLLETPLFMKSTTKISMDPMTELHKFLQMNQKIEQKIKCHKKTSSLKGFETDQIEPMFPALINLTLPFKDIKRSLSFSSLDDIKHLPYDLYARVMDIFIKNHIDEKVADEKAMLKIQTMSMNGFNDNLFTTVKSDPLNSAIDINCEKKKKRRKNQKRRNRKKKNRDKCKSFLVDEKKLANDEINGGPEPESVNTQSLVEPPLKTNITKSAYEKKDCFISKFFSFPCNYESGNEISEPPSVDWDDEEYENDDVSINGSLEKEFAGNGLFFSNLVSKEPRKKHCGIELSAKDFLFDSPTNNDFDDENIWVETPEEREFREKIQAMVAKANEEWDAISLPSDCNDNDVGVFQMEIKSPQITRHVHFVEEPAIWLIPDLED
ncbi:uncharacterized protein LOC124491998 [Dermatophagoides farinae]|uniref:uncharacterized protein LOC124491998 n=1 Tax=Dermatophagoides farinae TaxID=6954 RepID=UPI003F61279C